MKQILSHIKHLKAQLEALQPISAENQQRLDKKFRLEWNYNSNHMEGNTLTYGETELLLIFDKTKGNHELREYEEMKGHDVALKLIYDLVDDKERNLNENFIRQLNKLLLVRPFFKEAITPDGQPTRREIKVGEYKSFPNSVRLQNGEIFHYPSPTETPALMQELLQWYHENTDDAVTVAADLHYKFVCIHPFDDGNGRIARLLMNYHLLKNDLPPVVIKTEDKKNYLRALQETDAGNIDSIRAYIAEKLVWSLELSIKAAKGENIDELGDWNKKLDLLKKDFKPDKEISFIKTDKNKEEITKKIIYAFRDFVFFNMKSINDLFIEIILINGIKDKFRPNSNIEAILNLTPDTEINFAEVELSNELYFYYSLQGYKFNGIKSFDLDTTIRVDLKKYSYTVTFENNPYFKIENPYSSELSEKDFDLIANEITETLLKKIEETKG